MRRLAAIVALGCVGGLLLLGLVGFVPRDAGPASTPPDGTPTPDPGTYPPGVGPTGVENASALLAAHRQSLRDDGFVVATEYTFRTAGRARNFTYERRIAAAAGLDRVAVHRQRRDEAGGRSTIELWTNGSTAGGRFDEAGDRPTVRPVRDVMAVPRRAGTGKIATLLADGEFDLVAVTTGEGRTLYTLRGTGYVPGSPAERAADRLSFSAQVVVTGTGRIRSLSASLTRLAVDDGVRHVTMEVFAYRLERTGVETIPVPGWMDEVDATRRTEGSR